MGTGQSCDDKCSSREPASNDEDGESGDERSDPKEISSEAFDGFLTAILNTPPDKLPPIPEEEE